MLKKLLLSLFVIPLYSFSQVQECINNLAGGIYPCKDYDLMSNIPVSVLDTNYEYVEGSDIWGWTDPINGNEYAIVGLSSSTAFVNITNPVNPIFIGRLDSNAGNSPWRDVKIYNNYAFIVADNVGEHGMQVFDLKRLRTENPNNDIFMADYIYTDVGSCHNIVINETEAIAYLVGCISTNGGGPIFLDLSEFSPTSTETTPEANFINDYTAGGYSHDAQVITYTGPDTDYYDPTNGIINRQIYIGSNEDKVVILDVTDKNNVIPINDFTYTQAKYTHQGWFTDNQKYFILGDEEDEEELGFNTKTIIFDFSDLDADFDNAANSNLTRFHFGTEQAIDHNGYVKANEYFLANYRAGMRVFDLSNINNPALSPMLETSYFDTFPENNSAEFNGAWSIYPYFNSGNIIISDIERGLFIVRKSNTLSDTSFNFEDNITLSPNPTKDAFTIKTRNNSLIQSVSIYNLLGQRVFKNEKINTMSYKINSLNISKGIYLVKINNQVTKKLIIE